ncbi:hypothetical protein [Aridibaculum aurantiacum]|uniref:hypothetical protein n=1 Tax=Aridibaculum aurantiacum TaxID=2810307 RepID=UPI001A962ED8|nr:hypothetical protein [Aridibaculum aurantiacum]
MKQNLVEQINECLHQEEVDFVQVASRFGVDALPSLKKIISTNHKLAPKAIVLEEVIRLYFAQTEAKDKMQAKKQRFSTGMRRIATNRPDGHIKCFGSDMLRGKK